MHICTTANLHSSYIQCYRVCILNPVKRNWLISARPWNISIHFVGIMNICSLRHFHSQSALRHHIYVASAFQYLFRICNCATLLIVATQAAVQLDYNEVTWKLCMWHYCAHNKCRHTDQDTEWHVKCKVGLGGHARSVFSPIPFHVCPVGNSIHSFYTRSNFFSEKWKGLKEPAFSTSYLIVHATLPWNIWKVF